MIAFSGALAVLVNEGAGWHEIAQNELGTRMSAAQIVKLIADVVGFSDSLFTALVAAILLLRPRLSRGRALGDPLFVVWLTIVLLANAASREYNVIMCPAADELGDKECLLQQAHADINYALIVDVIITVSCFTGVMRAHRLIGPVLIGLLTYGMNTFVFGSPFPSQAVISMFFLATLAGFALFGAWRHEQHCRERWRQRGVIRTQAVELSSLSVLAAGMQRVAEGLCDAVLHVDATMKVCNDTAAHRFLFGRPVAGERLSELLVEAERERLEGALQRAKETSIPQLLPVSLQIPGSALSEANMMFVFAGAPELRYIIGVSSSMAPVPPDGTCLSQQAMDGCIRTGGLRPPGADLMSAESESVFVSAGLERVAELGAKERWLLDSSSLRCAEPLRVLGAGGFGVIVAAKFRGRAVAVKLLKPSAAHPEYRDEVNALTNEVRVLRHVRHPNIVVLFGAVLSPSSAQVGVVYELIHGQTLTDLVQRGYPEPQDRFSIVYGVCSALWYLHSQRPPILHNDIKADNVMVEALRRGLHAKLIDFGLSRKLATRSDSTVQGTRRWMPPEMCADVGTPPASSSDIFSYGWVVWFTMTGLLPHSHAVDAAALNVSLRSMMVRRNVPRPPAPQATPWVERVEELCGACLEFSPGARPDVESVYRGLVRWVDPDALRQLAPDLVMSLSPDKPWSTASTSAALDMVPGAKQHGVVVIDVLDEWRILSAQAHAAGFDDDRCLGESFLRWIVDPASCRSQLESTLKEVCSGDVVAPVVLKFAACRLWDPCTGDENEALLSIVLPDGAGAALVSISIAPQRTQGVAGKNLRRL